MKNILFFFLLLVAATACNPAKKCIEKIKPDCICTMQYDPVCGCNNKTYGNACAANCAGIHTYTKGACPTPTWTNLEGMVWQVIAFANTPIPDSITISIKFADGKVEGHGGCNHVGGTYSLQGNTLTISELMGTKMYCESAMPWENKFLQWLPKSRTYSIKGENLTINCGDLGNLVFRQNWKKRN